MRGWLIHLVGWSRVRPMKLPCSVVAMIAEFLCLSTHEALTTPRSSDLAKAARDFISGQMPTLVSLHVVDKSDEQELLASCERLAKGFASVILNEEEGT